MWIVSFWVDFHFVHRLKLHEDKFIKIKGKTETIVRLISAFFHILTFWLNVLFCIYLYVFRYHMALCNGQSFKHTHTKWLCINLGLWTGAIIKSQWALLHLNMRVSGLERPYVSLRDGKRGNRSGHWGVCWGVCVRVRRRERESLVTRLGCRKGWW